jgi:hypothetical protein
MCAHRLPGNGCACGSSSSALLLARRVRGNGLVIPAHIVICCNLFIVHVQYVFALSSPAERISHRSSGRRSSPAAPAIPPPFLLVYVTRIRTASSCLYSPRSIQGLAESRLLDRTVIISRQTYIDQAEEIIQHFWIS